MPGNSAWRERRRSIAPARISSLTGRCRYPVRLSSPIVRGLDIGLFLLRLRGWSPRRRNTGGRAHRIPGEGCLKSKGLAAVVQRWPALLICSAAVTRDPSLLAECVALQHALARFSTLAALRASPEWPELSARLERVLSTVRLHPLTDLEAGTRLTDLQAGTRLTDLEAGTRLTDLEAGTRLTDLQAGT